MILPDAAEHGAKIDQMFNITLIPDNYRIYRNTPCIIPVLLFLQGTGEETPYPQWHRIRAYLDNCSALVLTVLVLARIPYLEIIFYKIESLITNH